MVKENTNFYIIPNKIYSMGNTLLYQDLETRDFAYYRLWEEGNEGSSTVYTSSLEYLAEHMGKCEHVFEERFEPEGGIPNKDWGNLDVTKLRPLDETEVNTVVKILRN